jgi:transcriptional regulator with XRE-family HTH domain
MLKFLSMAVTQKDLARELGLTEAAVSMALRNHPRIGEATRKKAQALAQARGYVVNPAFSRRGSQRQSKKGRPVMPLALVMQRNPRYAQGGQAYQREVRAVGAQLGYHVTFHLHEEQVDARWLGKVFQERGVEAVLVGPIYHRRILEEFPWDRFSLAGCEAGHFAPPCHLAMPDVATAIADAVRLARERGYRRLAFAQIQEPITPVDAMDRLGPTAHFTTESKEFSFASRDFDVQDPRPFTDWMRRYCPDAVLGQTEMFYWWLKDGGWRVPQDMGYMNLRMDADRSTTGISGFEEDHLKVAQLACQLLNMEVRQFFRGPPEAPARMLVRMPWFEGQTLPPITSRPARRASR